MCQDEEWLHSIIEVLETWVASFFTKHLAYSRIVIECIDYGMGLILDVASKLSWE